MTPRLAGVLAVVFLAAGTARAQSTFVPTSGTQTWNSGANWSPSGVPNGVGVATAFGPTAATKTYTGPTVINQGRLRFTDSGNATGTSSIMVNPGGSLYLDNTAGVFTFGGGTAPITINGTGDNGSGTAAQTQGALRNQGS